MRSCIRTMAVIGLTFGVVASAQAVTAGDISAASPFLFGDLLTFNWRILHQVNPTIQVPNTPTGNQTGFVRMFSNGNLHNPVPTTEAKVFAPGNVARYPNDVTGYSPTEQANFWYGLEFDSHTDLVNKVLTADDVLSFIRGVSGPSVTTPLFAFDQNQEGSSPDIWLRARLILVKPSVSLVGLNATDTTTAVNAAIVNGNAIVFRFYDDPVNPPNFGEPDQFVLLPGVYDPDGPGPLFSPVNNNGAGNAADWGSYIPGLDLTNFPGYSFLLELEAKDNNDGKEEAYILGGLGGALPPIPEPLTSCLGLIGLTSLALATLRRRGV